MKGMNFEEWKALVQKRREGMTHSEIHNYESQLGVSSQYDPEYGQTYTITYNVTGNFDASNLPTEIKSGITLKLNIPIPYGSGGSVDANVPHTYENGVLTIQDVQQDIEIAIIVGDVLLNNNGHEYVDLGLPSGTLWATMNVGASSETDYGNYYQYGKGATQYADDDNYYLGTEDPLDSSVDTATQVWGGSWHMPTRVQMQELIDNTTYQWVEDYQGSGINGGTFTATNGTFLFLPAAGDWYNGNQDGVGNNGGYWGSSPNGSSEAYYLDFGNGDKDVLNDFRKSGCSVRGVIG